LTSASHTSLIYPDTIIWNLLCDEQVDHHALLQSLALKNATLVLSFHAVYELAKTFTGKSGPAVGVKLFSSLKKFLALGIPCSKEIMELLFAEAYAFTKNPPTIDPMATPEQCTTVKEEVEKLANGIVEARVREFIQRRMQFATDTRAGQKALLERKQQTEARMKTIPEADLPQWLTFQTLTPIGAELLYLHLEPVCPGPDVALDILLSAAGMASRAVVRADLYSNWRCANRGSNPKDLLDDMLHVLQSAYCNFYVTAEPGQADYANLLLTPRTKVFIYDRRKPVDQWLIDMLA
jgi:hypothetical protein